MLAVSDNGTGFADGFKFPGNKSLGLTLVDAFVKQLNGILEISNNEGLKYIIKFSKITSIKTYQNIG